MSHYIPTYFTPQQTIKLDRISGANLILDIGGGGEGIITRLENSKVCAVDVRIDEIKEAQIHGAPANWFVADGRELCFRDNIFDMVTFCFSLGYLHTTENKRRAFSEAYRVLRKKGKLWVMAAHNECKEERFIFQALFVFPNGTLSKVGYGVRGGQSQNVNNIMKLINQAGFRIDAIEEHEHWFIIRAGK